LKILIEDLVFETIIGLYEYERRSPQKISVNLEIEYNYKNGNYIDYVEVINLIKTSTQNGKYSLLEEAIDAIFEVLNFTFPSIESIVCKISKPNVSDECIVSVQNSKRF
jgi:dihydroneopterin aldolase